MSSLFGISGSSFYFFPSTLLLLLDLVVCQTSPNNSNYTCVVPDEWHQVNNQMIANLIKRNNIPGNFCNDPKPNSTNTYTRVKLIVDYIAIENFNGSFDLKLMDFFSDLLNTSSSNLAIDLYANLTISIHSIDGHMPDFMKHVENVVSRMKAKNRMSCVFHVRSTPPKFVHELLPNLKSVDLEESPFDTHDDLEVLKDIIGPVDIGRHRLMCGNSVYDFLNHLDWGNESWHKQVDKAIGWYETVMDRNEQAYKDDISKRPHLPLGYSFEDSREFSDDAKHKPHTKPAPSPKRISKHNWSTTSDTNWLLLSSPILFMVILILFSSMGVWIEKEVVKRRRIQQEREERLLMLKQMSTQQTGESKQ